MRTAKAVSISLPPEELVQAECLAKQTNRTLSGLVREGLKRLHAEQRAARLGGTDQYTPAERRIIDREIAKGVEEIRQGRMHGPFTSAKDTSAYIERLAAQRAAAKKANARPDDSYSLRPRRQRDRGCPGSGAESVSQTTQVLRNTT